MATSLTFLSRIRSPWDDAQTAVVSQFDELQAQLAPSITKGDTTATTVAALGVSIVPPYVASNFTGGGTQTWTVPSTQVLNLSYCPIGGSRILVDFIINLTTVGGVANPSLRINLPLNYKVARFAGAACVIADNGVVVLGLLTATPNDRYLEIRRADLANYTASAANTSMWGQLAVEVK